MIRRVLTCLVLVLLVCSGVSACSIVDPGDESTLLQELNARPEEERESLEVGGLVAGIRALVEATGPEKVIGEIVCDPLNGHANEAGPLTAKWVLDLLTKHPNSLSFWDAWRRHFGEGDKITIGGQPCWPNLNEEGKRLVEGVETEIKKREQSIRAKRVSENTALLLIAGQIAVEYVAPALFVLLCPKVGAYCGDDGQPLPAPPTPWQPPYDTGSP